MVAGWGLSWFPMKFTLPALPTLAVVFHVNDSYLKLSITLFFFCFALSQVVWGVFATGVFSWIESHLTVHSVIPVIILANIVYGVSFLLHLLAKN